MGRFSATVRVGRLMGVAVLLTSAGVGCATSLSPTTPLLDRLDGRGPVTLSRDNPFLPADRIFEQELASSEVIKEFVDQQGKPAALSIDKGLLNSTTMTFYYPGKEEFYTLKPSGGDWEVSGPDIMFPDEAQAMLSELGQAVPRSEKSEGKNVSHGHGLSGSHHATLGRSNGALSSLDTISARARLQPEKIGSQASATKSKSVVGTTSVSVGGKSSAPTKATIRRLANGSLEHTVTFSRESLNSIAKWYTGSPKNATAIAKWNKLKVNHQLKIGEKIVIPKQLLKTSAPMTAGMA